MSGLHSPNLDEKPNIRGIVATPLGLNPGFDALPRLAASKDDDPGEKSSVQKWIHSHAVPHSPRWR
jgi:hypothetical protein